MTELAATLDGVKRRFSFWRLLFAAFIYVGVVFALVGIAGAFVGFVIYDHVMQDGTPGPEVEVKIEEGMLGRDVAQLLARKNLVEYEGFFRLAMRLDRQGGKILPGIYDMPEGLSAMQYLHLIYDGPSRQDLSDQIKITIPEGLSIEQMGEIFGDVEAFKAAASNKELIQQLGLEADTLEGFLLPNTYFFDEQPTADELVARMVDQFQQSYEKLLLQYSGADAFDKKTIVTVASMVEEEAKVEDERPLVAAVLYNRLDKDMPLQMDSTLQYALGKYGERMLDEDKKVDSPYNTYMYKGLPPGPISSPGEASLRAALAPSKEPYLYFVSNADGTTHTFTETYAQHQAAVAKFRKEIAAQRKAEEEEKKRQQEAQPAQ